MEHPLLHPQAGTMIIIESCKISTNCLLSITEARPLHLFRWHSSDNTFPPVQFEVSVHVSTCIILSVIIVILMYVIQDFNAYISPNKLRRSSGEDAVVMYPSFYTCTDDLSGNRSKRWHECNNWCL